MTVAVDAAVIAGSAHGMPRAPREIPEEDERRRSLRPPASQREFRVGRRTRAKRRLRSVLPETDPKLEAAIDPSAGWQMAALAELGDPAGAAGAASPGGAASPSEPPQVRRDARGPEAPGAPAGPTGRGRRDPRPARTRHPRARRGDLRVERIFELLAGDGTCEAPPAIPGVGPRTAQAPAARIDISMFPGRARPAGCRGIAPARRTSRSSLAGTRSRFGERRGACTARGMRRNRALKAVARKRMKVIHATMRDKVAYAARRDRLSPSERGGRGGCAARTLGAADSEGRRRR